MDSYDWILIVGKIASSGPPGQPIGQPRIHTHMTSRQSNLPFCGQPGSPSVIAYVMEGHRSHSPYQCGTYVLITETASPPSDLLLSVVIVRPAKQRQQTSLTSILFRKPQASDFTLRSGRTDQFNKSCPICQEPTVCAVVSMFV